MLPAEVPLEVPDELPEAVSCELDPVEAQHKVRYWMQSSLETLVCP